MNSPSLFTGEYVTSRRILYQPSQFAMENLFYLQETGLLSAIKPHVSRRKGLASYLFFIVTKGSGELEFQGQKYELRTGDCVFVDCRKEYSQCTSKNDFWDLKWVHFNGSTMTGIYEKYLERGGLCVIPSIRDSSFESVLDRIFETASSSSFIRDMQLNQQLAELLTLLMNKSWNPETVTKGSTRTLDTKIVKNYIDSSFTESLSLEKVAREFNVNKSYLLRAYKSDDVITVNNYILQQRIIMAKSQLRFTSQTLESIAMQCGFGDANYFIRQFKKIEGLTPGEYRKIW